MAKLLSIFAILLTALAIFVTALAVFSAPYRRQRTSWLLGGGIIAYMLACCGIMLRAYLPLPFLYDNPTLARALNLGITGLNHIGILGLVCGVALYYSTEEDTAAAPAKIKRRKMSRNARLTLALGVATLIVAVFPLINSLPSLQAYNGQPLVLMSKLVNHPDGYSMFAIKNCSNAPVHDVTATFHGYADNLVTFTPRDPKFRVKFETPNPHYIPLERIISIEVGDLKPDDAVIVTIQRDKANSSIWFKDPPERPFAEPKAIRASHSTRTIPVADDLHILSANTSYGVNYMVLSAREIAARR
jgi:hypothetical protein